MGYLVKQVDNLIEAQKIQDTRLNEFALGMEKLSSATELEVQKIQAGAKESRTRMQSLEDAHETAHKPSSGKERYAIWSLIVTSLSGILYLILERVL